jgi:hypothetical protein
MFDTEKNQGLVLIIDGPDEYKNNDILYNFNQQENDIMPGKIVSFEVHKSNNPEFMYVAKNVEQTNMMVQSMISNMKNLKLKGVIYSNSYIYGQITKVFDSLRLRYEGYDTKELFYEALDRLSIDPELYSEWIKICKITVQDINKIKESDFE